MINWLNSHRLSFKYLKGIIKNNNDESINYVDETYQGLDNEKTPLRIFKSKKNQSITFILFPGASPFAEKHPGMTTLATAIMNLGFNVFIPRIPPLKKLNIKSNNVEWFARAYEQISFRNDVIKNQIIAVGISFGGSILLKATLDKRMQSNPPKSILMYGSCYDIESGLSFLVSGKITNGDKISYIKPHDWGLIVLFHNFIKKIDVGFETTQIEKILEARVADNLPKVEKLKHQLSNRDLDYVENILSGECTPQIEKHIKKILISQKESLQSISPSSFCDKILMKVFIMHGANDSMVPYTESIKLSQHLPNNQLLISHLYEHKEISTNSNIFTKIKEIIKLERFFAEFFKYNAN